MAASCPSPLSKPERLTMITPLHPQQEIPLPGRGGRRVMLFSSQWGEGEVARPSPTVQGQRRSRPLPPRREEVCLFLGRESVRRPILTQFHTWRESTRPPLRKKGRQKPRPLPPRLPSGSNMKSKWSPTSPGKIPFPRWQGWRVLPRPLSVGGS